MHGARAVLHAVLHCTAPPLEGVQRAVSAVHCPAEQTSGDRPPMNRKAIERLLGVKLRDDLSEDDDYLLEKLSNALDQMREAQWEIRKVKREQEPPTTTTE
jgi:hypothetical protein